MSLLLLREHEMNKLDKPNHCKKVPYTFTLAYLITPKCYHQNLSKLKGLQ